MYSNQLAHIHLQILSPFILIIYFLTAPTATEHLQSFFSSLPNHYWHLISFYHYSCNQEISNKKTKNTTLSYKLLHKDRTFHIPTWSNVKLLPWHDVMEKVLHLKRRQVQEMVRSYVCLTLDGAGQLRSHNLEMIVG